MKHTGRFAALTALLLCAALLFSTVSAVFAEENVDILFSYYHRI